MIKFESHHNEKLLPIWIIFKRSKKESFLTSNEIKTKIEEQYHVVVSAPTICCLQETGL